MTASRLRPLRGIVPPMITPLSDLDQLDVDGLERLIEHILSGGVHGLFILGTTGEAPSLSYRLRRELIERTCRQVDGRVPVLVGITDTSLAESRNMAQASADYGADAVVLAPPYYFTIGQPELIEHLDRLLDGLPLPLMLYNMPGLTKATFEPSTVEQLMQRPGVIGIKDSSGDMDYLHQLVALAEERDDWGILVGPEILLPESVMMGATGGVNGGANLQPRLYVDLYEAAVAGDLQRVRQLHRRVLELGKAIYQVGRYGSSIIKGLKCALSLAGICDDVMASPFNAFAEPERQEVQRRLAALNLEPVK
ncbi:dihydrodipicolinate synthase family protein [Planctomycetales bacterium ZRK34]|nr:dihydrodipicolinate synthase family protein [Planctomycetales bacterium ZRK34]